MKVIPNTFLNDGGFANNFDTDYDFIHHQSEVKILKSDRESFNDYNVCIRNRLKNPEAYIRKFCVRIDESYSPKGKTPTSKVSLYPFYGTKASFSSNQ